MGVDARRDHGLRVPRPDLTVAIGTPNACNDCHTAGSAAWAATAVRHWYGHDARGFQQFASVFAGYDRGAPGGAAALTALATRVDEPAIVRAGAFERLAGTPTIGAVRAAAGQLADPDPIVRRAALLLLDALPPEQRPALAAASLRDPSRIVRIEAARLLAPASSGLSGRDAASFTTAAAELVASHRHNADRPEDRVALGEFFADLGRLDEAEAEYQAAQRLNPAYELSYVDRARLVGRGSDEARVQAILREGLTHRPDSAALHHLLGLSLVREGRRAEAIDELRVAATIAPEQPRFAYTYGVALHSAGRVDEAIAVLEAAHRRHPSDRDVLVGLATFHRDAGHLTQARAYATDLTRLDDTDREARALLESLPAAKGPATLAR